MTLSGHRPHEENVLGVLAVEVSSTRRSPRTAGTLPHSITKDHPELAEELHFGDTEIATCAVWVESESTCKALMEVTWSLIQVS